jgi:hypothetical protein
VLLLWQLGVQSGERHGIEGTYIEVKFDNQTFVSFRDPESSVVDFRNSWTNLLEV